jgi:hypothetical protein
MPRHLKVNVANPISLEPVPHDDPNWQGVDKDKKVVVACSGCRVIFCYEKRALPRMLSYAKEKHRSATMAGSEPARDHLPSSSMTAMQPRCGAFEQPPAAATAPTQAVALQSRVSEERTVGEKRDRRDAREVVSNKRREYYPDGMLKSEVEETREMVDQGESVSVETKELRSQVLQLKQEHAVYELKVERTFKDRVDRAIASARRDVVKDEERKRAALIEDAMVHQVLAGKTKEAEPLDVFVLAKVVQQQRALIANLVNEGAATAWVKEQAAGFKVGSVPQVDHMADDLLAITDDEAFADKLPLLTTLGFSRSQLEALGVWPAPAPQVSEGVEETFEPPPLPMAPPAHPSPIDHLEKDAWTDQVLDECLAMTAGALFRKTLDPGDGDEPTRVDPPHLLAILDQFIRTAVYYAPGDPTGVIRNRKILAVSAQFKHPSGDVVHVQVDLHRLKSGYNRSHYREQICRFFAKKRMLC